MDEIKKNNSQAELQVKGKKTPSGCSNPDYFLRNIRSIDKIKRGFCSDRSSRCRSKGGNRENDPLEKKKFYRVERHIKTCQQGCDYRISTGPLDSSQQDHESKKDFTPFSNEFVVCNEITPEFFYFSARTGERPRFDYIVFVENFFYTNEK